MESSYQPQPDKSEHPSTYIVQDRSNIEELLRLDEQDHLITQLMGILIEKEYHPDEFEQVLDIGCGTGRWLIDMAKNYPHIERLAGFDVSDRIVKHARTQAEAAGVSDRVEFKTGDALRMIEYPSDTFDLVNQRLGMSYLRTWDWSKMLREYRRVCHSGGIIRVTENALMPETNSPALQELTDLLIRALYHAGHFFTLESEGVTRHLADQMKKNGITQVQVITYRMVYHLKPEAKRAYASDVERLYQTALPFMRKWIKLPSNYDTIYHQMMYETRQENFEATNILTTAWGRTE